MERHKQSLMQSEGEEDSVLNIAWINVSFSIPLGSSRAYSCKSKMAQQLKPAALVRVYAKAWFKPTVYS
jgi:hypothetical protein